MCVTTKVSLRIYQINCLSSNRLKVQVAGVSNQAAFNINCSALDFDGLSGGIGVGGLNPRCKTAAHVQPDFLLVQYNIQIVNYTLC